MQSPPFPTSRDLVNELRAVAGSDYQALITDLFERVVLCDARVDSATARPVGGGFDVTLEVTAHQFETSAQGTEAEVSLQTGSQRISFRVSQHPGLVGIDPFHPMIDRTPSDNVKVVD